MDLSQVSITDMFREIGRRKAQEAEDTARELIGELREGNISDPQQWIHETVDGQDVYYIYQLAAFVGAEDWHEAMAEAAELSGGDPAGIDLGTLAYAANRLHLQEAISRLAGDADLEDVESIGDLGDERAASWAGADAFHVQVAKLTCDRYAPDDDAPLIALLEEFSLMPRYSDEEGSMLDLVEEADDCEGEDFGEFIAKLRAEFEGWAEMAHDERMKLADRWGLAEL